MKTVSVRIKKEKETRLKEIAGFIPGSSINALVDRGIELFLAQEGEVYMQAFQEARDTISKRQPVKSHDLRQ